MTSQSHTMASQDNPCHSKVLLLQNVSMQESFVTSRISENSYLSLQMIVQRLVDQVKISSISCMIQEIKFFRFLKMKIRFLIKHKSTKYRLVKILLSKHQIHQLILKIDCFYLVVLMLRVHHNLFVSKLSDILIIERNMKLAVLMLPLMEIVLSNLMMV